MITQETRAWSRVRLDRERADLDADDLAYASNVDLFLETGTIRTRRGITALLGSSLGASVRRLGRFLSTRFQVAGTVLYREGVSLITGLSATLKTTFYPYQPLSDTTTWLFVADASGMKKVSGSTVRTWGIAAKTETITQYAAPSGSLTGDYSARVTPVRFDGSLVAHEGNPCSAPTATTLSSKKLALADILDPSDGHVNGIGIYRTVADGADHYLDARVNVTPGTVLVEFTATYGWEMQDPAPGATGIQGQLGFIKADGKVCTQSWEAAGDTAANSVDANGFSGTHPWERTSQGDVTTQTVRWGYISSMADSALGAIVETDNDRPPAVAYVSEPFQDRLWLCQDGNSLWFTKRFRPEAVPPANYLTIGDADDECKVAIPIGGILIAFTGRSKWRVVNSGVDAFQYYETPSKRGVVDWQAACAGEDGVYFVAWDGVFRTTGFSADELLSAPIRKLFEGVAVNGYSPIDFTASILLYIWMNRLYMAYTDTAGSKLVAVHWLHTDRWQFYQYPSQITSFFFEKDAGQLTVGCANGQTYVLEDGTDDVGTAIAWIAETGDRGHVTEGSPSGTLARHLFRFVKDDVEPNGSAITMTLSVDGTAISPTYSLSATRQPTPKALPTTAQGYRWRKRWAGSGPAKIYGTSVLAVPLEGSSG